MITKIILPLSLAVSASAEITYELAGNHESWPEKKKAAIVKAMDEAVALHNKHHDIKKHVWANYNPKVPTANANLEGWINFGGSISTRTALHEISHTLGVGTHWRYRQLIKGGSWKGEHANALIREFEDDEDAVLKGDKSHMWPYGLNYAKEVKKHGRDLTFERHVKLVEAVVKDIHQKPEKKG